MRQFISWLLFIAAFILFGSCIAAVAEEVILQEELALNTGAACICYVLGVTCLVISVVVPDPEGCADTFYYYFNRIF